MQNKRQGITVDIIETEKIVREYYQQWYINKLGNLDAIVLSVMLAGVE